MAVSDQNRNLVAALSYLLGFITGIVILLVEKEDRFIRFHAMQSIVVFGALFVADIVIGIIVGQIAILGVLATVVNTLFTIAAIIIWVVSLIKAYQGEMYKWPIAGDFAEKNVAQKNVPK